MEGVTQRARRRPLSAIRAAFAALGLLAAMATGSVLAQAAPAGGTSPAAASAAQLPVVRTASGSHVHGSLTAPVKLIEFISYTCPYCAIYEMYGAPLRTERLEKSGVFSVEVRHVVHDSVDLATALLARCGPSSKFFERHNAYMHRQRVTLSALTPELERIWDKMPIREQMPRIARDVGLLEFSATLGTSSDDAQRCLTDTAEIATLEAMSRAAVREGGETVPGFVLNGKLLADIHSWAGVRQYLDPALIEAEARKPTAGN